MPNHSHDHASKLRRAHRTRVRLSAHQDTPRLTVFRSLRHISAQLIDDKKGKTLAAAHDVTLDAKLTKTDKAKEVGKQLAEQAKALKIKHVRFDKGAYKYHGRVAALADAARTAGLEF